MIFCSAVKFVRLVTKISCCHRNCQSLTVHLSGIKFEDVSINLCFKCSWLHGNSIHFLQLWMELHWFWWGCQRIIVWKLTPVLNFLSQSEETPGGYCYLYWILPQVTFKVYHTKLWEKKKKANQKNCHNILFMSRERVSFTNPWLEQFLLCLLQFDLIHEITLLT